MADLKETQVGPSQSVTSHIPESMTSYNLYYTRSMLNVTFHKGDKSSPVVYYARSKLLNSRPIFNVRQGSKSGEILSHVQCPWYAIKTFYIGLGDYTNKDTDEVLQREKLPYLRSDYHFTYEKKNYVWQKDKKKSAATAFECVDEEGQVLAIMLSGGAFNWQKAGEVYIQNDVDVNLQYLLLAGAMGIWSYEGLSYQSLLAAY